MERTSANVSSDTFGPSRAQLPPQANASEVAESPALASSLEESAIAEFRAFLKKNKDSLHNGMGAFHTDGHSNW